MSAKPEVELIFTIAFMENSFNMKYIENDERYDVRMNADRKENLQ